MTRVIPRVERAQKDLEIQTEAARLSAEFALNAKMIKVARNIRFVSYQN